MQSGELRAAHIAAVHVSAGPSTTPGRQREERRAEWKTQRRQVRTPALYAPALLVSPHYWCPRIAACDQSPGWRRAARLQEDEAKATGTFPAESRHPFSAPRHRVFVCVADFSDMPCGLLHPWVPQRPYTSAGHDVVPSSAPPQAPTGPTHQPDGNTGSSLRARAQHTPASQAQQAHQG
ncbi:hypothetical protein HaLaN_02438 [Haematococcus lacustris]|uniref:Uncharacterized protein n=1 Tax=Haematococcus lacustris TaxID=44745 RepID=A0A699YBQ8_HAELA|nr:hypothetical protein HaLaN_02438 [Haematococcus lacustris]